MYVTGSKAVRVIHLLIIGAAACCAASCATLFPAAPVQVPIEVKHPAEIDMAPYRQVVIGDIEGNMAQGFAGGLKETLVNGGQFKVLDRRQLAQILGEMKLSQTDLADPKYRAKIGKLISAAALITGHTEGSVDGKTTYATQQRQQDTGYKDSEGDRIYRTYNVQVYTRTCWAHSSGSIEVVDLKTGEIVKSKTLRGECEDSSQAEGGAPGCARTDDEYLRCAQEANVSAFAKAISPWSETKMLPFEKHSAIPELEVGIRQVQAGDLAEAGKTFETSARAAEANPQVKPKVTAKAFGDLGLVFLLQRKHDSAVNAFKKAYILSSEQRFLDLQNEVKQMAENEKKLRSQGSAKRQ